MSINSITIKPNNHRVYPCSNDKKIELLNQIISENKNRDILVVCSTNIDSIKEAIENKEIKVIEDRELVKLTDLSCEMLISYDIPIKAIVYMARVSKATSSAVILVDASEQKNLYPIEMLLGRSIKQEIINNFEYEVVERPVKVEHRTMSQSKIKEVAKKRYDAKFQEDKPRSDDKKDFKKRDFKKSDSNDKWAKKKKEPNKFLGYDEKGKGKFSGKSGERNHRFDGKPKDKYDTPKKVGRKINIKELKEY